MTVEFGLRLPPCLPVREMASAAVVAETAGFDVVWVPDSQMLWRDVWVTLTAMALATTRVRLGTNVTNPTTRQPTVTSAAAISIDELSNGRMLLGMGAGGSSVRVTGEGPARLSTVRQSVETIRALSAGEWVPQTDGAVRQKAAEGRRRGVPVYLGAAGPKMLQLAGEVADGVILLTGLDIDSLTYTLDNINIGLQRAGRKLTDIDIVLGLRCYVGEDWRAARRLARPFAARYALRSPEVLRAAGIPVPDPQPMPGLYPDLAHAEDWEQAIALTDWIPDDVLNLFCEKQVLMGDIALVRRKLEHVISFGISHFYIMGFESYQLPMDLAQIFARHVMPHFK